MTDDARPIYEPGDVIYGVDPYKGADAARPWLVLSNHHGRPFHGQQYIVLSLTSRTWMDGLIEIDDDAWVRGGTPDDSYVVPWGVQSIDREDVDIWQGRLEKPLVRAARESLVAYLQESRIGKWADGSRSNSITQGSHRLSQPDTARPSAGRHDSSRRTPPRRRPAPSQ